MEFFVLIQTLIDSRDPNQLLCPITYALGLQNSVCLCLTKTMKSLYGLMSEICQFLKIKVTQYTVVVVF